MLILDVLAEFVGLAGPDPRAREELEFVGEKFAHAFEVASQVGFAGNLVHGWIVVDLLIGIQTR